MYSPNAWDNVPHYFYLDLDYSSRNMDSLTWRFKAGCTRCDQFAAINSRHMKVTPILKQVLLSVDTVNYIFQNEAKALTYTKDEFMRPMYKELHELHSVIDELYMQDCRQRHQFQIKL